jgi:UDP-glucuronate 4-epimerase
MKILITGTAGFIGFHLVKRLVEEGHDIVGLDNINSYYDVDLKFSRLENTGIGKEEIHYNKIVRSSAHPGYKFIRLNLEDDTNIYELFKRERFDKVCHLAAQAGVRYSIENPRTYIDCNIVGFLNILEACRYNGIGHLVYASSSSVYGLNEKMPFSAQDNVDHPVSLYAASKKSNELMAHTYSHLYGLPTTGLRFFTVYGPWGRPDMALFLFTKAILENKSIYVYNDGQMERDFTYIDDIIEGITRIIKAPPHGNKSWSGKKPDPSSSAAPYRVYNIGNNKPVKLLDFIESIEKATGKKATRNMLPMQPGDVPKTWADVSSLTEDFNYKPRTSIEIGIKNFVNWYCEYNNINSYVKN